MAVEYSSRRELAARAFCAAVLALILLLGATPLKLAAQAADDERILSYDVAIRVHPDSSMAVEETIRVVDSIPDRRHAHGMLFGLVTLIPGIGFH